MTPTIALIARSVFAEYEHAERVARHDALVLAERARADLQQRVDGAHDLLIGLADSYDQSWLTTPDCQPRLADLRDRVNGRGTTYIAFLVIRPDAMLVCNAIPISAPVDVSDRAYFRRAVATQQFSVGDVMVGRVTGQPSLNVALPVLGENGEIRAILGAAIDLGWVADLMRISRLPAGSTVLVLDPEGTVLVGHPAPDGWIGQPLPPGHPLLPLVNSASVATVEGDGPDGVRRLFATTPVAGGSTIVVGIPRRAAFAEVEQVLWRSVVVLLLVAACTALAAWIGSQLFILRPVQQLVAATRQLASGNLHVRSGVSEQAGVLGELGTAFDGMAQLLQQRDNDRAHAEARLRFSEAHHRQIVEGVREIVFRADLEGRWTFLNLAWTECLGYSVEETLGRRFQEYLHPNDRTRFTERFAGLISAQVAPARADVRYLAKDGSLRRLVVYASLIRDAEGRHGLHG